MSGYGSPDCESLHAIVMSENECFRVQQALSYQSSRSSRTTCRDCDDPIPQQRLNAINGCQYCVQCQPNHEQVYRTKMLTKML